MKATWSSVPGPNSKVIPFIDQSGSVEVDTVTLRSEIDQAFLRHAYQASYKVKCSSIAFCGVRACSTKIILPARA